MPSLSIAILTSGRGTLVRYTMSACLDGVLDGAVAAVLTNRDCPALGRARRDGVPVVESFESADFGSRADRDGAMAETALATGVDFVLVGGYSEVLEHTFLDRFPGRAISVYPTLLPAFGELDESIGPALAHGVKALGLTIHLRAPLSLSDGPILAQYPFPVDHDDTIDTVAAQIAGLERAHLPEVMQAFAEERVVIDADRARILPRGR